MTEKMPDVIWATPYETDGGHGEWDASKIVFTTEYFRADRVTEVIKQARDVMHDVNKYMGRGYLGDPITLHSNVCESITSINKLLEETK